MSEITVEMHERIQKRAALAVAEWSAIAEAVRGRIREMLQADEVRDNVADSVAVAMLNGSIQLYCAEKIRDGTLTTIEAGVATADEVRERMASWSDIG
jgi:hypothetical protein